MTNNERVKQCRKALNLNQADFGEKLGVSGSAIAYIELGKRSVTDQMKKAICNTYNVSEIWLDSGVGDMFRKSNHDLAATVDQLLLEGNDTAEVILTVIKRMNKKQWDVMAELLCMVNEEMNGRKD